MSNFTMNDIIKMCLEDPNSYTPRGAIELMQNKDFKKLWLFETNGAYLYIAMKKKGRVVYKKVTEENGHFSNLKILKTVASFYEIELEEDIEPYLSEFLNKLKEINFLKPILL